MRFFLSLSGAFLCLSVLISCVSPRLSQLAPDQRVRFEKTRIYYPPAKTYYTLYSLVSKNDWVIQSSNPASGLLSAAFVPGKGPALSLGTEEFLSPLVDYGDVPAASKTRFRLDFTVSGSSDSLASDLEIKSLVEVKSSTSSSSWISVDPSMDALIKSYESVFSRLEKELLSPNLRHEP